MKTNSIKHLERSIALVLLFIPLLLIVATGELRPSISDYAYSDADNLYSGLLWLAASMFGYNAVYSNKVYNWALAGALLGISLTDHLDYPLLHYLFASVFFIGSVFVMTLFSSTKQRVYKVVAGALMLLVLLGHFVCSWYNLLVAEWICLSPISIHFIGESMNKID